MTDLPIAIAAVVLIVGSVMLAVGGLLVVRPIGRGQSTRHNGFISLMGVNDRGVDNNSGAATATVTVRNG